MSKIITIDAGHGGTDPGAYGNGMNEKDKTLEIAKILQRHLKRHDITTHMTRETDKSLTLAERSTFANKSKSDAFISIHCNAFANGSANGVETFMYDKTTNENSKKLRKCVHSKIKTLFKTDRGEKSANFHVLRETFMTAILVEVGFITNKEDAKIIKEKIEEIAKKIAIGIVEYYGIKWKEEETPKIPTNGKTLHYRVIAGSYASKTNAQSQQNKLNQLHEASFILPELVEGKIRFRLICGSYTDKQNALKKQKELKSKKIEAFLVAFYK